jgi:hypothetical protein
MQRRRSEQQPAHFFTGALPQTLRLASRQEVAFESARGVDGRGLFHEWHVGPLDRGVGKRHHVVESGEALLQVGAPRLLPERSPRVPRNLERSVDQRALVGDQIDVEAQFAFEGVLEQHALAKAVNRKMLASSICW